MDVDEGDGKLKARRTGKRRTDDLEEICSVGQTSSVALEPRNKCTDATQSVPCSRVSEFPYRRWVMC